MDKKLNAETGLALKDVRAATAAQMAADHDAAVAAWSEGAVHRPMTIEDMVTVLTETYHGAGYLRCGVDVSPGQYQAYQHTRSYDPPDVSGAVAWLSTAPAGTVVTKKVDYSSHEMYEYTLGPDGWSMTRHVDDADYPDDDDVGLYVPGFAGRVAARLGHALTPTLSAAIDRAVAKVTAP